MNLFPRRLLFYTTVWELFELPIATLAGAWIYGKKRSVSWRVASKGTSRISSPHQQRPQQTNRKFGMSPFCLIAKAGTFRFSG